MKLDAPHHFPRFTDLEPGDVVTVVQKNGHVRDVPVKKVTHNVVVLEDGARYSSSDGARLPRMTWAQRCACSSDHGMSIRLSEDLRKAFLSATQKRRDAVEVVEKFGRTLSNTPYTTDEIAKVASVILDVQDAMNKRTLNKEKK